MFFLKSLFQMHRPSEDDEEDDLDDHLSEDFGDADVMDNNNDEYDEDKLIEENLKDDDALLNE